VKYEVMIGTVDPKNPVQRGVVVDETGRGVNVMTDLTHVIGLNGGLSATVRHMVVFCWRLALEQGDKVFVVETKEEEK